MMLTGFADPEVESQQRAKQSAQETDHVAWSVPPAAVAGLRDRPTDWDAAAPPDSAKTK